MSTDTWKLEKDLCRCCHAEGSFYDLSEPRCNLGQTEVYSKMLKHCFDLEVTPVTGVLSALTFTICESCVLRLRDASNFKRQVQSCEERFKNMYKNAVQVMISEGVEVKEEAPVIEELKQEKMDDDEDYCDVPVNDDDEEDNKTVYELKVEDAKKAKAKPKPKPKSKPRPKKPPPKKAGRPRKSPEPPKEGDEKDAEETNSKRPSPEASDISALAQRIRFRLKTEDFKRKGDMYHCKHCENIYKTFHGLFDHVKRIHYNIKMRPHCKCSICGEDFKTPSSCVTHQLEKHNVDLRFCCNACDKKFSARTTLNSHMRGYHMLGDKLKCKSCNYETYNKNQFRRHKLVHTTVKDKECSVCKKTFKRLTTLRFHERIHKGDKRKVCAECGQAFVQKASLNYHMAKYHPGVKF